MRFNLCTMHRLQLTMKMNIIIWSNLRNPVSVILSRAKNLGGLVEVGGNYGL